MPSHNSFFRNVEFSWSQYQGLRNKYYEFVPIPQQSYFQPIHSVDEFTTILIRPIYSPLWLKVNAALLFLKSMIYLMATLLLIVPALLLALLAPNSQMSNSVSSAFKQSAAQTLIDATMGIIAVCAALAAIVFNPIFLLTRCLSTVVEHLNEVTESCCDLTIARF